MVAYVPRWPTPRLGGRHLHREAVGRHLQARGRHLQTGLRASDKFDIFPPRRDRRERRRRERGGGGRDGEGRGLAEGWQRVGHVCPFLDLVMNPFAYCKFLRLLGHVIVIVVLSLVALSYYPVVVSIYGTSLLDPETTVSAQVVAVFVIVSFHVLGGLMLWSYFAAILTSPGHVPEDFRPDVDMEENNLNSTSQDKSDPRRPRFCRKCQRWKPERTHHCSICGKCVLKMDHHCVWVMNCVGERNYKFFFLFLCYTFLLSLLSVLALLPYFSEFFKGDRSAGGRPADLAVSFMAFVVDLAFSLSLFGFIVMHVKLIAANCTTIEMFEKERIKPWPYDQGLRKNFEEVFGSWPLLWFLPMHADGACSNEERLRLRM